MEFQHHIENQICIVSIQGSITIADMNVGVKYLDALLELDTYHHLLFNLEKVKSIDSSGISLIIYPARKLREQKRKLGVVNLSDFVKSILIKTGLDTVIDIFETEAQALKAIK